MVLRLKSGNLLGVTFIIQVSGTSLWSSSIYERTILQTSIPKLVKYPSDCSLKYRKHRIVSWRNYFSINTSLSFGINSLVSKLRLQNKVMVHHENSDTRVNLGHSKNLSTGTQLKVVVNTELIFSRIC